MEQDRTALQCRQGDTKMLRVLHLTARYIRRGVYLNLLFRCRSRHLEHWPFTRLGEAHGLYTLLKTHLRLITAIIT